MTSSFASSKRVKQQQKENHQGTFGKPLIILAWTAGLYSCGRNRIPFLFKIPAANLLKPRIKLFSS